MLKISRTTNKESYRIHNCFCYIMQHQKVFVILYLHSTFSINLVYRIIVYNYYLSCSTIMSKIKNIKQKVIEDSDNESDSSVPIIAAKTSKKQKVEEKKIVKKQPKPESEEEDTPIVEKKPTKQVKTQTAPVKKAVPQKAKPVKQSSSEEESEEEKPKKAVVVAKVKSPVQKPVVPKKKVEESEEESESQEAPKPKAKVITKAVPKAASPVQHPLPVKKVVAKVSSSEEESEEEKPVKKVKSPIVKAKSPVQKPVVVKKKVVESSEESEEEKPQPKKVVKGKPAKKESSSQEQSEQVKPAKKAAPVKAAVKAKKVESSQEQEEEKPQPKKAVVAVKSPKAVVQKKHFEDIEEEEKPKASSKIVDEDEDGQFQICVKGLSFNAYDSDIKDFFDQCGNVVQVKLLTRDDGKSKGIAFVKFSKKSSFNKGIALDGAEHMSRSIKVEEAQGKKNNDFGNKGGSFGGAPKQFSTEPAKIESNTLFIGGLSYNSTVDSIKGLFASVGEVTSARIVTDKQTGKPRGFGYVEFYDIDTAKKAYDTLNGSYLDGRSIRLDAASQRDRPQGGSGFGGGARGGFGGGFGGPRNGGNSAVVLSQDDKNAKKGSIGTFAGKKIAL